MNNKENKKLSDDYIDKLIGEIESTGDVLDDLTTDETPSQNADESSASPKKDNKTEKQENNKQVLKYNVIIRL